MAVYGDPHVKVMNATKPVTCGDPGQQEYLVNDFFKLTGVNKVVDQSTGATAVDSVRIYLY